MQCHRLHRAFSPLCSSIIIITFHKNDSSFYTQPTPLPLSCVQHCSLRIPNSKKNIPNSNCSVQLIPLDYTGLGLKKILNISIQSMRKPYQHTLIIIQHSFRFHKIFWDLTRSSEILQDLLRSYKIF